MWDAVRYENNFLLLNNKKYTKADKISCYNCRSSSTEMLRNIYYHGIRK
jgi:hypothetical protein